METRKKANELGSALLTGWQDLFESELPAAEEGDDFEDGGLDDTPSFQTLQQQQQQTLSPQPEGSLRVGASDALIALSKEVQAANEKVWRRILAVQLRLDIDQCMDEVKELLSNAWQQHSCSEGKEDEEEEEIERKQISCFADRVLKGLSIHEEAIHCTLGESVLTTEGKDKFTASVCSSHKQGCWVILSEFFTGLDSMFLPRSEDVKNEKEPSTVLDLVGIRKQARDVKARVQTVKAILSEITSLASDAVEMVCDSDANAATATLLQSSRREIHMAERNVQLSVEESMLPFVVQVLFRSSSIVA
jgi:hypothetical protein